MTFFVGSTNPVKINAVRLAAGDTWPDLEVLGFETKSGVPDQPLTDEQTRAGAINRASSALKQGLAALAAEQQSHEFLGFGLEGGVLTDGQGQMWSTVWAAVITPDGDIFEANGARVKVPTVVADAIRRGEEMGPIMQQLTGFQDVRKKQGMFGIITNNFVTRTEEYGSIAKMALGLWYGQDWDAQLSS